jgi:hypothetical protein
MAFSEEKVFTILKNLGHACACAGKDKHCPDQMRKAKEAYLIGVDQKDSIIPGFLDYPSAVGWWMSGQPLFSVLKDISKSPPLFMCIKATPYILTPDKVVSVSLDQYIGF